MYPATESTKGVFKSGVKPRINKPILFDFFSTATPKVNTKRASIVGQIKKSYQ